MAKIITKIISLNFVFLVYTNWGTLHLVNGFQVKPATKDPDNQDLIKQLYEQIGQLSVERDWLKKKSTLFGLGN